MEALEIIRRHYEERDLSARKWKQGGGKVVAYVSDDVPEEMILAAGLFPFRLSGDPWSGTEEADKYTESFYDPSVRSILNMFLIGKYDFVDFVIIPHHSDSVLKLFHQMWWINRIDPAITFPPCHLFDVLHTSFLSAGLFIREQVKELKTKLEEWSGRKMDDSSLTMAIREVNENRALLNRIADLRTASPSRLSGSDGLRIIGTSSNMSKKEHSRLLKEILTGSDTLPEKAGPRLFVEGSDLDNLQLYDLLESCGANVVSEDSNWGNRYGLEPVDESVEPMEAIAERYHLRPSRYRTQSLEERVRQCVDGVVKSKAEAVLFYLLEWDPAPAWDLPVQKKALEQKGFSTLSFQDQKYLFSESAKAEMSAQVGRLIDSMKRD